jgi:hypothetical protein
MSAQIKHIYGGPVEEDRQPNKKIVEKLERFLDEAQRGDITSFAYAYVKPNQFIGEGYEIGPFNNYALNAAVDILHSRIRNSIMDGKD